MTSHVEKVSWKISQAIRLNSRRNTRTVNYNKTVSHLTLVIYNQLNLIFVRSKLESTLLKKIDLVWLFFFPFNIWFFDPPAYIR